MTDQKPTPLQGEGTLEQKEEALKKDGTPYWKFKIDGKTYSLFEYELGHGVKVGDKVGMIWIEKEGKSAQGGSITYRNLNSIYPLGELPNVPVEEVSGQPTQSAPQQAPKPPVQNQQAVMDYKARDADKYELGMAKNNAAILFAKLVEKTESLDEAKEFLSNNATYYEGLVKDLFNRGKEIRKELIGY